MQIDLGRFRSAFFVEAAEHLQQMEAALLQLESAPRDSELLNTIFRCAHSIKGGSATFGAEEISRFTHVLENLLERLRNGAFDATPELVELLLASIDVIDGLLANAKDNQPIPAEAEQIYSKLLQFNDERQPAASGASAEVSKQTSQAMKRYRIAFKPSADCFEYGTDPLLILKDVMSMGAVFNFKVDTSAVPPLELIDPEKCYVSWTLEVETAHNLQAVRDAAMFLNDESRFDVSEVASTDSRETTATEVSIGASVEKAVASTGTTIVDSANASSIATASAATQSSASPSSRSHDNETVRVDRNRLDMLINQIGELVIGTSMVEQDVLKLSGAIYPESLSSLAKVVRDLQEMSLSLRMVPIATAFQKLNRVLRDLTKKLGKQIDLHTEGDDTELDKTVVDQISDPLIHMIRNAVDHGIESSEERIAMGKSPVGKIELRAFQQGGNIFIVLSDDGRGLNRDRIVAKATERGLIEPGAVLSDADICNLIFQPGFSTAEQITDVSGRGVGMDVVRKNVESLQGSVSLKSEWGRGSTVTVRLPLTLAILDGLLIRLTDAVYVIPLLSVVESISIDSSKLSHVVRVGEVLQLRGEIIPVLRLHQLMKIPATPNQSGQMLLVIVEDQGKRLALAVDELLGQQQVVIKNLETNLRKVPGVAGATILGDGRVALILDLMGLSSMTSVEVDAQRTVVVGNENIQLGASS